MIQPLIKLEQDMDRVIHGVNRYRKLALYNLPLSIQILVINIFISIIGFIFLIFFNYFLITNDDSIENKTINANQNLNNIKSFLQKNAIIRVPLFDDNCTVENNNSCKQNNNIELSEPVLEPKITQEFIINNYLKSDFNIKIYNDDWIRLVDTMDLYDLSIVQETELDGNEIANKTRGFFVFFLQEYLRIFSEFQNYFIKKQFQTFITTKKAEISYVAESIKEQTNKQYIVYDDDKNLYQYFIAPIENNKKVYGVIIFSYPIINQASDLGFISLSIFSFFILFILIMIFMSLVFSQSLVRPIKKLSKLTTLERERVDGNKIKYPNRKDEIGALSKEIQSMSKELNLQIQQLEKFSADVSHELKNPLTSLQSAIELINKKNISKDKKKLLTENIQYDLKRMNQLITDISNFTRLKAEIELEKNEYIKINDFLDEIPKIFTNNNKEIKILTKKYNEDITVLANKNKLTQVFVNLVENSISLSPIGSKILIEVDRINENTISLKFYDQGSGVSLKDSEKIFDRFYSDRGDNFKNHTGLGLSIVREIITHMKGQITLEKSDKDYYSGACFFLKLPIKHFPKT